MSPQFNRLTWRVPDDFWTATTLRTWRACQDADAYTSATTTTTNHWQIRVESAAGNTITTSVWNVATNNRTGGDGARMRVPSAQHRRAAPATPAPTSRARALLVSCLDEQQRAEFAEHNHFHVTAASGRVYLIRWGYAGNVDCPAEGERFCIHASSYLPVADQMLIQKLMLDTDEEEFRRVANISRIHVAA